MKFQNAVHEMKSWEKEDLLKIFEVMHNIIIGTDHSKCPLMTLSVVKGMKKATLRVEKKETV